MTAGSSRSFNSIVRSIQVRGLEGVLKERGALHSSSPLSSAPSAAVLTGRALRCLFRCVVLLVVCL